jgi:membrane-bound metal-dependent hydrolase YbcI (DUF457 family)
VSKTGHLACGAAVAYTIYHVTKDPVLALAILPGSLFPDFGEGVIGYAGEERLSLIPHRTLTHSIWIYALAILAAHFWLTGLTAALVTGVSAGAILHLALDVFSPMGIPLLSPFGARTSIGPFANNEGKRFGYRTGSVAELPFIALTLGGCFLAVKFL